jgi:non-ribosomal peptide synthetase component F
MATAVELPSTPLSSLHHDPHPHPLSTNPFSRTASLSTEANDPLSHLPLPQRHLFTALGTGTSVPLPHTTLTAAFHAAADAHPLAMAVVPASDAAGAGAEPLTYAELDRRANVLANRLLLTGLRRGARVVCVYRRGVDMCVAVLAVLKAGAQYVPLDGGVVAPETLAHVLRDAGAPAVLTLRRFRAKVDAAVPGPGTRVVELDAPGGVAGWRLPDERRPEVTVGPEDGAYVIYTSGTTGKPKGVDVRHGGACNTLLTEPGRLGIRAGKNVGQVLSVSFDMGLFHVSHPRHIQRRC